MKDFVVYHNPDSMGFSAREIDVLSAVTNKLVGDVHGDRVWLLTGEGKPRKFQLCAFFTVDAIESGAESGFRTRLSGGSGRIFKSMPILNDEEWFPDFKKSQGNFSWGFSPISNDAVIQGLETIARESR